jgi:tRNA(Ile)-lysidine synthase
VRVEFIPPYNLKLANIPEGKFLLACSGGIDSVVLFDLLIVNDVAFEVAHVNYGLRGHDSNGDEAFVRALCQEYSIQCHVHREVPKHYPGNTQDNARRIRYAFFGKILKERKLQWLLTAHHGDDQVETLLINLARGSGLRGLAGIPVRRDVILRPLLGVARRHIQEYAEYHRLQWREDYTNAQTFYKRNALRADVIPNLRRIFPDYVEGVARSVKIVSNVLNAIDFMARESGIMVDNPHGPRFPEKEWMQADFAPFLLFHLLQPYGFSEAQIVNALRALKRGQVGRFFNAPGGVLYTERGYLQLYWDLHAVVGLAPLLPDYPVKTALGRIGINLSANESGDAEKTASWTSDIIERVCVKVKQGEILYVRQWKAGDSYQALDGTRRKVSDVLTNYKVPAGLKSVYPVVVDTEGQLVWLPGLGLSDLRRLDIEESYDVELSLVTYTPTPPFWAF